MIRILKFICFFIASIVWFLFLQKPMWNAYLATPNKLNLDWDYAVHFKEGLEVYIHLIRFDLIALVDRLLSLEYWLPTHPLLEAISLIVSSATSQFEACVYLNHVTLAVCYSLLPFILFNSYRARFAAISVLTGFCLAMFSGKLFIGLHHTVMVETVAYGLTLLFVASSARFFFTRLIKFHKILAILLLLIFMTKIHYGILLSIPFLVFSWPSLWARSPILSWAEWGKFFRKLFSGLYIYLVLAVCAFYSVVILLQIRGTQSLHIFGHFWNIESFQTTTWPIFFAPLFIWTVEWVRKNNPFIDRLNEEGQRLHHWVLFPFAWYYLLPGYQKVCFLLGNFKVAVTSPDERANWGLALTQEFLGFNYNFLPYLLYSLLLALAAFWFATFKKFAHSKVGAYLLSQFFFYFLFIAIVNKCPMTRLVSIWAAQLLVILFWVLIPLVQKMQIKAKPLLQYSAVILLLLITGFAGIHFSKSVNQAEVSAIIAQNYLPLNFNESNLIFNCIDPKKPGILYGLGMTPAAPLFTVWSEQNNYAAASKSTKDKFFASDLGWGWKESPKFKDFVLDKFRNYHYSQFVFFRNVIPENLLNELTETITTESAGRIKLLTQNQFYVLLAHSAELTKGCPLVQ